MEVPWPGNLCILCLKPAQVEELLTAEHIIPQSLGGRLWAKFLCKMCNDYLGSQIEAEAKRDPSISMAIETLSSQIPELAKVLIEGRNYTGKSKLANVHGKIKRGEFRVKSYKEKDGSLIQPTDEARRNLERMLRKEGSDEKEILLALRNFDDAPLDTRIKIKEGLELVKWDIDSIQPALDGKIISDMLPLKIGFEFLACHLGSSIYDERLNNIRNSILNNEASPDNYKVEHLRGAKYEPFHGIVIEKSTPYIVIQIRLFGWLAYRVHLLHLALGGPRFSYTLDLKSSTEDVVKIG